MNNQISRRDFLNGVLLASGGLLLSGQFPLQLLAQSAGSDGEINTDPRALRAGNLPSGFRVGHWMRDGRLSFAKDKVTLAAGVADTLSGTFRVEDDAGKYDVVIVGSGISGLSSAFFILKSNPKAKILILDANSFFGGNASLDEAPPLPVPASAGGSYCVAPFNAMLKDFYSTIGINWEQHKISAPMYSYFFDEHTPGVRSGYRGWNIDTYGKGIKSIPYSEEIVRQLEKCRTVFLEWGEKTGAPTDPADESSPQYDYLAGMTLHDYLTKDLKCDPIVSDFFTRYTIDALGGTAAQVNAHSSISFLGAEYGDLFAFPGGNAGLARHLVSHFKKVAPGSVQIRLDAGVVKVDQGSLVYYKDSKFTRISAKAVILAGQSHTSQHLVKHLLGDDRKAAWKEIKQVPVVVANVAVKSAAPFVEKGFGYNQYWWGSKYWADFVIADWVTPARSNPNRPTVLTFFGGNTAPAEELPAERYKLLNTPFSDYENSVRDDLTRIMAGSSFHFDKDVTGIFVYRWGHGMLMPTTSSVFLGKDRAKAPRHIATARLGRISFAGQDTEGTPSVESAIASGHRAALEVLNGHLS